METNITSQTQNNNMRLYSLSPEKLAGLTNGQLYALIDNEMKTSVFTARGRIVTHWHIPFPIDGNWNAPVSKAQKTKIERLINEVQNGNGNSSRGKNAFMIVVLEWINLNIRPFCIRCAQFVQRSMINIDVAGGHYSMHIYECVKCELSFHPLDMQTHHLKRVIQEYGNVISPKINQTYIGLGIKTGENMTEQEIQELGDQKNASECLLDMDLEEDLSDVEFETEECNACIQENTLPLDMPCTKTLPASTAPLNGHVERESIPELISATQDATSYFNKVGVCKEPSTDQQILCVLINIIKAMIWGQNLPADTKECIEEIKGATEKKAASLANIFQHIESQSQTTNNIPVSLIDTHKEMFQMIRDMADQKKNIAELEEKKDLLAQETDEVLWARERALQESRNQIEELQKKVLELGAEVEKAEATTQTLREKRKEEKRELFKRIALLGALAEEQRKRVLAEKENSQKALRKQEAALVKKVKKYVEEEEKEKAALRKAIQTKEREQQSQKAALEEEALALKAKEESLTKKKESLAKKKKSFSEKKEAWGKEKSAELDEMQERLREKDALIAKLQSGNMQLRINNKKLADAVLQKVPARTEEALLYATHKPTHDLQAAPAYAAEDQVKEGLCEMQENMKEIMEMMQKYAQRRTCACSPALASAQIPAHAREHGHAPVSVTNWVELTMASDAIQKKLHRIKEKCPAAIRELVAYMATHGKTALGWKDEDILKKAEKIYANIRKKEEEGKRQDDEFLWGDREEPQKKATKNKKEVENKTTKKDLKKEPEQTTEESDEESDVELDEETDEKTTSHEIENAPTKHDRDPKKLILNFNNVLNPYIFHSRVSRWRFNDVHTLQTKTSQSSGIFYQNRSIRGLMFSKHLHDIFPVVCIFNSEYRDEFFYRSVDPCVADGYIADGVMTIKKHTKSLREKTIKGQVEIGFSKYIEEEIFHLYFKPLEEKDSYTVDGNGTQDDGQENAGSDSGTTSMDSGSLVYAAEFIREGKDGDILIVFPKTNIPGHSVVTKTLLLKKRKKTRNGGR
ncbi:hypothetical protein NEFER03_2234 [Nematocida sp. LUAm3]|nr:hypothetical protein NEFER03_2234 [Nematocida sp. LUAm3]KAI5176463.1 hypothetical protein NEFER02_2215 [Nematocida sp. LUAm2]KAI5179334.1 hypothetical protein NEFER01_2177 [Nematocida sp. LUAm1]